MVGERYGEQPPIIQTMFVLQNTKNINVSLPNVEVETEIYDNEIAKFDLLLAAIETTQGLQLYFEYKKNLFDIEFIKSMSNKYLLILNDILKDSKKIISNLASTEKVIVNNDPLFDVVSEFTEKNIVERFYEMAIRYKDKTAVCCNGEEISYIELEQKSSKMSQYINRFLKKETGFIGVCMERSIDMIVCILAVLKSNCAYVPLDPDAPKERMEFIVKDAELKLLIGHKEKIENILIPNVIPVIDIQAKKDEIMKEFENNLALNRNTMSTAYMIYTSGSTGDPKGVMVSDYNVLRLFSYTENLYNFNNDDVWTMFHSMAFDFSVWEIWGALLYGGKLVIVPYKTSRTPDAFLQLIMEQKVTVLNQTPSAFRQLLQCDILYDAETVDKMNLRYIIFGGEALDFGMLEPWIEAYGDESPQLVNMYGITETTVHVTYEVLVKEKIKKEHKYRSIIGRPIKDLQIYILDKYMRMVPDGVVGEMYVGGAGVSKGYWNREKLTSERFIQNPFVQHKDILYKTGDLACRHTNGDLEYIGRNDKQVKIKGFRIELNEIQEKINQNEIVKDNLVILDKVADDARIISYFTLDGDVKKRIIQELLNEDDYDVETEEVFNHNYQQYSNIKDDMFNIVGWNNSYDKQQMSETEMREWLNSICSKLYEIPMRSVLEIGVGTGMIMHNIVDRVEQYVGLDISKEAIDYNNKVIKNHDLNYENVELIHTSVENLGDKVKHSFDTIIINSVVQYFPDIIYFENVLFASIKRIHNHGHIVVGDIRNYNRLDMYYLSVELYRMDKTESLAALKRNIHIRRENEKELIFDPNYFKELQVRIPQITCVEVTPKRGNINNELSKFRYDVILTIDKSEADISYSDTSFKPEKMNWTEGKDSFKSFNGNAIHYVNILDERIEYENRFLQNLNSVDETTTIANYEKIIKTQRKDGLSNSEIKEIEDWAQRSGYKIYIGIDNIYGCLDLIVYKDEIEKKKVIEYLNSYYSYDINAVKTTEPLKYKIQYNAVERIVEFLQDKLPYYMIPNEFVMIEKFPLTINGKVDYQALPKPNTSSRKMSKTEEWCEEYIIQEVTRVWKNLLHVEEISPDDNFFQLGGHSLLATNLIFSLNDIFNVRIPLKDLFSEPTIIGNSRFIQNKLNESCSMKEKNLNLESDIYLPEILKLGEITEIKQDKVLVTGATGFFGSFLVQRLLEDTTATVYCLVRARDCEQAKVRLFNVLRGYKLYKKTYEERIIIIHGDLELPYLGMDKTEYDSYAKEIDTIIHNGAKVNFFEPYENLKNVNVNGTQEIIKFATLYKVKPLHFISTLYVYEPLNDTKIRQVIEENQPLAGYKGLRMGYTQSKWVAEKILNLAREQGLPVNIYRLGRISGHSMTGACQQKDFLWSLVKGCIEMGIYPDKNLEFEFTPVNYLTDAVIKIMKSGELNTNYHLFNRKKTNLQSIVNAMSGNYKMKMLSNESWIESISSSKSSIRHLAQLLSDGTFDGGYMEFKNDNVVKHVSYFKDGIQVSDKMLKEIRNYFVKTGYFPTRK